MAFRLAQRHGDDASEDRSAHAKTCGFQVDNMLQHYLREKRLQWMAGGIPALPASRWMT